MMEAKLLHIWRQRAKQLKMEVHTLYMAYRDPRTPWYAKLFIGCVVGYALSPIDVIPDFIPVLGYVDDMIIVPLGVAIALKMIPPGVLDDCREKARQAAGQKKLGNWLAAAVIIAVWIFVALFIIIFFFRLWKT
jgi:uncharacterized membrane protein YkvA (DUF1232 family)